MTMLLASDISSIPYYEIYMNGRKMKEDLKKYITEVQVEESDSEADLCRITISDTDKIFINNTELTKKMPIKIVMGHEKHYRVMLDGEVTHIEANFGEDNIPVITIGAIDKSNRMTYTKHSRKWASKKASEIVQQIARSYGFTSIVQTTNEIIEEVVQEEETDAQLISRLADGEAFQWYLVQDRKELYFGSRFYGVTPTDTIHYSSGDYTILSFTPTFVEKNKEIDETSANVSTSGDIVVSSIVSR